MNFKYKNFDLGLNFNGAGGNKIYNHVAMSLFNVGSLSQSFNTTNRAIEFPKRRVFPTQILYQLDI